MYEEVCNMYEEEEGLCNNLRKNIKFFFINIKIQEAL